MECRSENVTQGPSPTGLHFIMSPAGPASRRGLRAIHLGVVGMALPGGHCQCCHLLRSLRVFSVAAPHGSWSGSSSHLISLPRRSSAWLWDQPLFPIQRPDSSSRLCQQTRAVWRFTSVDNLSFLVFIVCFFKPRERAKICSMSLVNTNCYLPLLSSSLTRLLPYLYSFLSCRDQGVHAWVIRKVGGGHTCLLGGGRSDQPVACHSCQCIK